MENGIVLCGPVSEQKNEIVKMVEEYFEKSSEVVLSKDTAEHDTQNFVVYVGNADSKEDFVGIMIIKKFYDTSNGRLLSAIAGEIIVDYMNWCKTKKITPAEPSTY